MLACNATPTHGQSVQAEFNLGALGSSRPPGRRPLPPAAAIFRPIPASCPAAPGRPPVRDRVCPPLPDGSNAMPDDPDVSLVPAVEGQTDDLARLKALVLDSVTSPNSRRAYDKALDDFLGWYRQTPRGPFRKAVVQEYRVKLEADGLAASTINVRLAAILAGLPASPAPPPNSSSTAPSSRHLQRIQQFRPRPLLWPHLAPRGGLLSRCLALLLSCLCASILVRVRSNVHAEDAG